MSAIDTNRLLGYPGDARLLIINADDFGMCHSVNEAILRSLTDGVATSTTLMTPCPWAPHAMQMLRDNPDIAFGVHLTLVCDFANYRWRPVASRHSIGSLLTDEGYFYADEQIPELLAKAGIAEVEVEFRAQIESVLAASLRPTHLDWHCMADGGREDVFDLTFNLAREYGLALRIHKRASAQKCQHAGLPVNNHGVLDSYRLDPDNKPARFAHLLRELPAGLTEWAIHPSLGNEEARALEPGTWRVRRADLDFAVSAEARDLIHDEGIVLLDYRSLQAIWAR